MRPAEHQVVSPVLKECRRCDNDDIRELAAAARARPGSTRYIVDVWESFF
jgi:hypothetical protein